MALTIKTHEHAYKVADHINSRMVVGQTAELAGFIVTKTDDKMFTVKGEGVNPSNCIYVSCEFADFVVWPNRKAWNAAIKGANQ